ncbi:hypothetical protein I4R72_002379 [Salmonella enterica]|nr:hypothetical protein [Salmonella enterica]
MKIEHQDGGEKSRLIITSSFIGWRKHIRLVDEILMRIPQLREESEGFFIKKTYIYGETAYVLYAEIIIRQRGEKLK